MVAELFIKEKILVAGIWMLDAGNWVLAVLKGVKRVKKVTCIRRVMRYGRRGACPCPVAA